jgi:hypothetical protein
MVANVKTVALIPLLAVLLCWGSGCASKAKAYSDRDWSGFIGNYTYDQATSELGRPNVEGQNSDGHRFGEWVLHQSSQMSFGFGVGGGSFGSHSATGVGVGTSISPPPHGEYLRLDFGPDGKLTAWSKTKH